MAESDDEDTKETSPDAVSAQAETQQRKEGSKNKIQTRVLAETQFYDKNNNKNHWRDPDNARELRQGSVD